MRAVSSVARATARRLAWCVAAFLFIAAPACADYRVPAGGNSFLTSGTLDLACTDLIVSGTFHADSGFIINVRNINIQAGGLLYGGTSSILLSGNLTVASGGQFLPEQSRVVADTACGTGPPQVIPALANETLFLLAALLACIAVLGLRRRGASHQSASNGAKK
jgi:hypothetical protein